MNSPGFIMNASESLIEVQGLMITCLSLGVGEVWLYPSLQPSMTESNDVRGEAAVVETRRIIDKWGSPTSRRRCEAECSSLFPN